MHSIIVILNIIITTTRSICSYTLAAVHAYIAIHTVVWILCMILEYERIWKNSLAKYVCTLEYA